MARPKLIVIDIDGTLIDSKTKLSPKVIDTIHRVTDDGALVTLATGRMVSASQIYIDELKIDLPTIALNGAFVGWVGDSREPIYHEPVSFESSRAILRAAWDIDATLIFVCCDRAFGRNISDLTAPALETWIVNISPLDDIDLIDGIEPTAILVAGEKSRVMTVKDATLSFGFEDITHYFFPSIRYYPMHYFEVRARGTDKGKGLAMLAEYLGISREEILAIGDYINDVPMAEIAGRFATPSNAHPEALTVADYISPFSNDENAVADILEKLYFDKS
ncbi:hypothetical protein DRQ36_02250 [bacterium]|mgnify:CR=1 FL=1|nr:MAG: hypothetical protein DRQ36_02250 [bacterium]